MHWIDWLIVLAVLLVVLFVGLKSRKYIKGVADFLTAGRVAVFAATFGRSNALSSFGFYDEDRKREILDLLHFVCGKPVEFYYPGDAEVYLKVRRFDDGRYLLAFFNLGHDELNILPVNSVFTIVNVEMIAPDGSWEHVVFVNGCLQTPLFPAQPKVVRITVK